MERSSVISAQAVLLHNNPEDCWIVVEDEVWDVTEFIEEHPGGAASQCLSVLHIFLHISKRAPADHEQ